MKLKKILKNGFFNDFFKKMIYTISNKQLYKKW